MDFESRVTEINKHFFFDEFTYSNNKFQPTPKMEVELADNLIWIGRILIVFQLKERNADEETNEEKESKWFSKKVLTKASQQIRDTIGYLEDNSSICLENHRGHTFDINLAEIDEIHKIICYSPNKVLSLSDRRIKYKTSNSVGFIHIFSDNDYQGIVETLLTPTELCEYLNFRKEILEKTGDDYSDINEQSLLGQFLTGDFDSSPSNNFYNYLLDIDHRIQEWDISGIIKKFTERIITEHHYSDYYKIISEIALLKRNELREFKKRFELSMKSCGGNEFITPYRMYSLNTGCGFVFIPLNDQTVKVRQQGLPNLTYACKYDLQLEKCIGISFYPDGGKWYLVEWCYIAYEYTYDEKLDELLKKSNPFRPVHSANLGRYNYYEE